LQSPKLKNERNEVTTHWTRPAFTKGGPSALLKCLYHRNLTALFHSNVSMSNYWNVSSVNISHGKRSQYM